ncbi:MAG: RNA pyrophosphohydrolase [Turneriella sp.]|nr:RNA pyrophosphohydrolase [Turneriella sp.]
MQTPPLDRLTLPYRPNVGIVVFNKKGLVLVGERLDNPGKWQYPQGGVDEGEDFSVAAHRELAEETGIKDAQFLYEAPDYMYYDFPPELVIPRMTDFYRGQMQKWHLAYWDHPLADAILTTHTQEFARVNFIPMAEATNQIVPFKKEIYATLEKIFLPEIARFLEKK